MIIRKQIVKIIVFSLVLFSYSFSNLYLLKSSTEKIDLNSNLGIWALPNKLLLVVTGEFKGLSASLLTLEIGSRLGTDLKRKGDTFFVNRNQVDWDLIHSLFLKSQALDPAFLSTMNLIQGYLPWKDVNMVDQTQRFIEVTAVNRMWDWQPYRTMAFNSYYFLNDNLKAGEYFLKAAQVENAPPFLGIVGSRLALKGGSTDMAIVIVKSMLADMNVDDSGYNDLNDRFVALQGVRAIENGIKEYRSKYGNTPENVNILVDDGIIKEEPVNPYNIKYCISKKGEVFFDNPMCNKGETTD